MTTMNAPISFPVSPADRTPAKQTFEAVATPSTAGRTPLAGVFAMSVFISFFTLLGMQTAQSWAIDRYLIPKIDAAYADLRQPTTVAPALEDETVDTAVTTDPAAFPVK